MLAELLAMISDPETAALGVQGGGVAILLWTMKRIGKIERDVAVIKDRLQVKTTETDEI
jgi:hypothetical protein